MTIGMIIIAVFISLAFIFILGLCCFPIWGLIIDMKRDKGFIGARLILIGAGIVTVIGPIITFLVLLWMSVYLGINILTGMAF